MGLHGGEWRIHASAVDECKVIEDAVSWLSGGSSEIVVHKEKSTLGAPMQTISVKRKGTEKAQGECRRSHGESYYFAKLIGQSNKILTFTKYLRCLSRRI